MSTSYYKHHIIIIALSLLLAACGDSGDKSTTSEGKNNTVKTDKNAATSVNNLASSESVSKQFNEILDNYYEDTLKIYTVQATFEGDNRYNDRYPNLLDPVIAQQALDHFKTYQAKVSAIPENMLSETEKMTKAVFDWEMQMNIDGFKFDSDLTPLDQMWTDHLTFGQLASGSSAQPFATAEDYDNWLKRVDDYLVWLQSTKGKMQQGMTTGYVLPKSLIKKVLPQLKSVISGDLDQHLFFQPVKKFPAGISETDQTRLLEAYTSMVQDKVIPTYTDIHDFMAGEYMQAGRDTSGIDAIPGGKDFYQHQIKLYTTTNMTAEEIHALGLSEVARIRGEMETVKAEVGFEGDLRAFFDFVRENKELMPFDTPEQIIEYYNEIHERMQPQVEKLFDLTPKTPFEVRRVEPFREKSAAAHYNPGSLDGTRPGIFYTPIPDAARYNIYDSESLFLHEAIPGHHFQISLTQESKELPKFRKTLWYSGYGEGWALYTESLGKELGLFTDPYQYFGMLSAEMHRAIRLVVDTGLHAKGWTREQAIQYSLENEAEAADSIEREIERYMANPGQALAYKIGQLKIQELRAIAETELGASFNIAQFHNQVLETGCVPLALLEGKIRGWITQQKSNT
jgi:uncharacterized protein (DUF885 family)